MAEIKNEKIENELLLYDPMFAKKPPEGWEDSEKGGIFGKAATKKAIFIVFLLLAIGGSLFFSFRSLSKDKYSYKKTDSGYQLSEFNGGENDRILFVEHVLGEDGTENPDMPVVSVRNYAVCCNEYLDFIIIGRDVAELEYNCFYYCTNLKAVLVDENNPSYTSVDGVLYNKDMTEIIIHPIKNREYRAALSRGITPPSDAGDCARFTSEAGRLSADEINKAEKTDECSVYEIPATVTDIAPFCFNYCDDLTFVKLPEGLKTLGQMAFFKCASLESIYLPDGLESIGADGLSYCEKLDYIFVPASVKTIGHHAFYGCLGVDAVYLGAQKNEVKTGESWLPKQGVRTMKNVEAVFGAERRNG